MSRRVHMPKLGYGGASVIDQAPLFCGAAREPGVLVTIFASQATCKRCQRLNSIAVEDAEHLRLQAKRQRDRGEEARP